VLWIHPDQELELSVLRHRLDIAAAEHRRTAAPRATVSQRPSTTRLRRLWAGLVGPRPHAPSAGHAAAPTRT